MLKFHKESDFHLPQSHNCLLGFQQTEKKLESSNPLQKYDKTPQNESVKPTYAHYMVSM